MLKLFFHNKLRSDTMTFEIVEIGSFSNLTQGMAGWTADSSVDPGKHIPLGHSGESSEISSTLNTDKDANKDKSDKKSKFNAEVNSNISANSLFSSSETFKNKHVEANDESNEAKKSSAPSNK